MENEYLKQLKSSQKSTVSLIYSETENALLVEKQLAGNMLVYESLQVMSHPYLPKLYSVQFDNESTTVVEEYIPGGSLVQVKAGEHQLTRWLLELCYVLSFLHKHGIIHRDIKPSNILIGADGHIRLIDFDAARIEKPDVDTDTRHLGTRGYAPPEQYGFSQTDQRSDIYALGVTFRELLGDAARKPQWKHILDRCTALEPRRRYRSANAVRWAIVLGRIRKWVLYPIFGLLTAMFLLFSLWSYTTDTAFKDALDIVLSSRRDLVFDTTDIDALKQASVQLQPCTADPAASYNQLLGAQPGLVYISTGYADENGNLLFGGFTVKYYIETGQQYYQSFQGLYAITPEQTVIHIPPQDCTAYAPAVLTLYELDTFNTPIF